MNSFINYLRTTVGRPNASQRTAGVKKTLGKVQLNKYKSEDITYNTNKSLTRCIYSIWGEKIYVNLNILHKISFYDQKKENVLQY